MNKWLLPDPPPPDDIDPEIWMFALEYERARVRYSMSKLLGTPASQQQLREDIDIYEHFGDAIDPKILAMANEKVHPWERDRKALMTAMHMRLPASDPRALKRVWSGVVLHQRWQCAVGQGGFHTAVLCGGSSGVEGALLWSDRPSVVYVYDCGSEPRMHVDREIDRFVERMSGRSIDLLFLSHFDRDHICGTPYLLRRKGGLHVDTIVIPYVDDVERMIAFARNEHLGQVADTFFTQMIVDPVETLNQLGPRQILIVLGEEDLPDADFNAAVSDLPRGDDDSWTMQAANGRSARSWRLPNGAVAVGSAGFSAMKHVSGGSWSLLPYVQHADPKAVANFKMIIEAMLDWPEGTFATRLRNRAAREALVTTHRMELGRAYRRAFGDKNITSLCLYSGPGDYAAAGAVQMAPALEEAAAAQVGWLGTGDADLASSSAIREFEARYKDVLGCVQTFVLPHHGSIHNSDPTHLVSSADTFVVSAEPRNPKWEHPAEELVAAVERRNKGFRHVSSIEKSEFVERLIVFWPQPTEL